MGIKTSFMVIILLLSTFGAFAQLNGNAPRVSTVNGILKGTNESGIKVFKGVPFAAPPVGELRWKEPQPLTPWEGVRNADHFGPNAMQLNVFGDMNFGTDSMSEDCLYLNIWTPSITGKEGYPVLVYFHGGGLVAGSGSEPRYAGERMARRGLVVITVNYRLGIFGFLAHSELSSESTYHASGNYGYLDQVAALKWIKENIEAFGGDPNRVTIAGESAGSISVSALMCSPLSKHLFAQAIGSSGSLLGTLSPVSLVDAEKIGADFVEKNGFGSIAEMRAVSALKLLEIKADRFPSVVDGYFLPEQPIEIYSKGEQARVPLLVGWNSQEMLPAFLLQGKEPTVDNLKEAVKSTFGDRTDEVLEMYHITDDASVATGGTDMASDMFIGFSTWKWSDIHLKTSGKKVFRYKYCHPRPDMVPAMGDKVAGLAGGVQEKDDKSTSEIPKAAGAVHSADIEYAMGNLPTNRVYDWQPEDYVVSDIFQIYYADFVKTGNPNGVGVPKWDALDLQEKPVLKIDVDTDQKTDEYLEARYKFLDGFFFP